MFLHVYEYVTSDLGQVSSPGAAASIKKKHLLDMANDLELTTANNDKYTSTPCLGNVAYFYESRKIFHASE